jgi:ankyrin repeat protein
LYKNIEIGGFQMAIKTILVHARLALKLVNQKNLNLLLAALLVGFSADLAAAKKKKKKKKQEKELSVAQSPVFGASRSPEERAVFAHLSSSQHGAGGVGPVSSAGRQVPFMCLDDMDGQAAWENMSQRERNGFLRDMVALGDLKEARELLAAGASANYGEEDGVSLMQLAQGNQDVDMIYLLMQNGALIDDPQTEFYAQVKLGDVKKVGILLATGTISINDVDPEGRTALIQAAQAGNAKMVALLLDKTARAQDTIAQWPHNAFRAAYENGHMDVVRAMLMSGVLPCEYGECDGYFTWESLLNEYKQNKKLPFFELLAACAERNFMDDKDVLAQDYQEQLEYLQENCDWRLSREVDAQAVCDGGDAEQGDAKFESDIQAIDIQADRQALAFSMINRGDVQGLERDFIQSGFAELLAYQKHGLTPLDYAVVNSGPKIVDKLLDCYRAYRTSDGGNQALNMTVDAHIKSAFMYAAHQDNPDIMALFLDGNNGCDINYQDANSGNTVAMEAIWEGNEEVLEYLLARDPKPDLSIKNSMGDTAFMCAVKQGSTEMARMLLDTDLAGLHFDDAELQECLRAEHKGNLHEVLEAAVARKSNMANEPNEDGDTPLIMACREGDKAMVQFLLGIGVNHFKNLSPVELYPRNKGKQTAFDVASDANIRGLLDLTDKMRYGLQAVSKRQDRQKKAMAPVDILSLVSEQEALLAERARRAAEKGSPKKAAVTVLIECLGCKTHVEKVLYCAACGQVAYCSRECQKADWKRHKPECVQAKKASAVSESPVSDGSLRAESPLDAPGACEDKESDDNSGRKRRVGRVSPLERKTPSPGGQAGTQSSSGASSGTSDKAYKESLEAPQKAKQAETERVKKQQSADLVLALQEFNKDNRALASVRYCREQGYMLYGKDKTDFNDGLFDKAEAILFLSNDKRLSSRLSPTSPQKLSSKEFTRAAIKQAKAVAHKSKSSGHARSGAKNKSPQFKSGPPVQPGYARRDTNLKDVPLAPSWRGALPVQQDNQADQAAMLFAGASGPSAFTAVSSASDLNTPAREAGYIPEQSSGTVQIAEDIFDAPGSEKVRFIPGEDADFALDYERDLERLDNGEHVVSYHQQLFPDGISELQDGGEQYGQHLQEPLASQAAEYQQGVGYKKIWSGYDWLWVNMRHIMYGDKHGGGHLYNEDKTCFPRWMESNFEQRLERAVQNLDYQGPDHQGRNCILGTLIPEGAGEVPVRFKGRMATVRGYVAADPETGQETVVEDKNSNQRVSILGTIYPIYDREYGALTGL